MDSTIKDKIFHSRPGGLIFTTIIIERFATTKYLASFDYSYNGKLFMNTTMQDYKVKDLLNKVQKFLQTEVMSNEWKIKLKNSN
jgi:hypothetical protein